jgi:hypothetical protein
LQSHVYAAVIEEKQKHVEALGRINQTLDQISGMLGQKAAPNGRAPQLRWQSHNRQPQKRSEGGGSSM